MNDKTLNVNSQADAQKKVSDVEVFGNTDLWPLICKASSKKEGWMKSTKAMQTPVGVVVQTTTQQGDQVVDALCFIPGISVADLGAPLIRKDDEDEYA